MTLGPPIRYVPIMPDKAWWQRHMACQWPIGYIRSETAECPVIVTVAEPDDLRRVVTTQTEGTLELYYSPREP